MSVDYERLFTLANVVAGLCWLPLLLAPRSAVTARFTATPLAPLAFAVAYTALVVVMIVDPGGGGLDSLAAVREGFSRDAGLLLGWVHYLSFDMMVGFWEVRDSRRLGLNPWLVAPCVLLTFLLGPLGLLLYAGVRLASGRGLRFDAGAAPEDAPSAR